MFALSAHDDDDSQVAIRTRNHNSQSQLANTNSLGCLRSTTVRLNARRAHTNLRTLTHSALALVSAQVARCSLLATGACCWRARCLASFLLSASAAESSLVRASAFVTVGPSSAGRDCVPVCLSSASPRQQLRRHFLALASSPLWMLYKVCATSSNVAARVRCRPLSSARVGLARSLARVPFALPFAFRLPAVSRFYS